MADNRTKAQMLQAPIEGYEDAIVVPNITVKLLLFPFPLKGKARIWLDKEPPRSILTWEDLVSKFTNQFFPPSKTTYLRNKITNFHQKSNETFNEAWERFKDLLHQCPHQGFSELHQLDTFYNALNPNDQQQGDSLWNSFGTCLFHLDKMLKRCEHTNICLNWEKSHFMVKEGIVLGHKISKNGIEVDKAKVDVITKLPHPTTIKGIRSFLGYAGFYRRYIQDFLKIARPMTRLLEKVTEYPEYLAPSDDKAPLEDQPRPADASPTAASPGYLVDFDLAEDPKENAEDDHADYPADGGDGDDEPSDDDDDTDDEDE
nr:reverse transcriptase domain-containing protein [Tanacetum cinerariifolium]